MPRSFQYYVLPAADIPVFYKEEQIGKIDVPHTGEFAFELEETLCKRITKGEALVRVLSEVILRTDAIVQGLRLTAIRIEDLYSVS